MQAPEIPVDEAKRLSALYATNLFGTGPEEAFDRITRMTTRLLGVPTALISLVGSDVQWFKSRCGFSAQYTSREVSFCGHAILTDGPLVIPDTARDPRFADNPIVVGAPYIRFYAGVQLYSVERARLGTLCIIDTRPREFGDTELAEMQELARMVEELIYHRQLAFAAKQLHEQLQAQLSRQIGTQISSHMSIQMSTQTSMQLGAQSPNTQQQDPGAHLASAAGQVEFLLTHDTLTGLANRQALLRMICNSIKDWRSRGVPATVACLNIDRFNRINEALGHAAGDEVLVAVTRSLKANLAPGDMLARTGNDEFVLVLDESGNAGGLPARLLRLMDTVNHSVFWSGHEIVLTCSIGVTCFPQDAEDAEALLNNAAAAMHHAKALGGARVEHFALHQRHALGRRMALESHLRRALERGELYLQYQPKIDLRRGTLAGFEALLRWRHPEYGIVAPDEFIPIAEETGLIVPIGEWIVGTAIRQMAAWREEGLPAAPVAVNLSARQFLQGDVVATIEHLLKGSGVGADALELELTESVSMADPERSLAIMHRLKKLGVTLSIDDFGTGYSSFSYLKRLPIDKLKIDKSFVHDMVHSADSRAIVGAIVAMAHRLNLRVVAEGVELEAQASALRDSGCDQAQGFLYARPLDAHDAGRYLAVRPEQARLSCVERRNTQGVS